MRMLYIFVIQFEYEPYLCSLISDSGKRIEKDKYKYFDYIPIIYFCFVL